MRAEKKIRIIYTQGRRWTKRGKKLGMTGYREKGKPVYSLILFFHFSICFLDYKMVEKGEKGNTMTAKERASRQTGEWV